MWRTRPCDRRDPGTGNSATNSKLPRPSIKAASDHAGPLRTPFPSRRLRFLKPRQVVVCLVEPRSNGIARETRRLPPGKRLNSRAVDETPGCLFNATPESQTNFKETPPLRISSDVVNFTNFMRFLAPPPPSVPFQALRRLPSELGERRSTRLDARYATRHR